MTIQQLAAAHRITHVQHLARTAAPHQPAGLAYVYRPHPGGLDYQVNIAVQLAGTWTLVHDRWAPSYPPAYSDIQL